MKKLTKHTFRTKSSNVVWRRGHLDAGREHLGMTQDEAAFRLGISQAQYAQPENEGQML
ncbi:helix-turn-helix domain-containing protein [Paraburkholderia phytofirmans]|uniref:helix-turn-helix domain-containing protein n=1 Tax=Paraburkholderia phytofirmans TaxID=261302 RepID=UPI0038BCB47D